MQTSKMFAQSTLTVPQAVEILRGAFPIQFNDAGPVLETVASGLVLRFAELDVNELVGLAIVITDADRDRARFLVGAITERLERTERELRREAYESSGGV